MENVATFLAAAAIFGVIIYGFWKQGNRVNQFMEKNKNVSPLLMEKAAQLKYNTIRGSYNANHPISIQAGVLHQQYQSGKLSLADYLQELNNLLEYRESKTLSV